MNWPLVVGRGPTVVYSNNLTIVDSTKIGISPINCFLVVSFATVVIGPCSCSVVEGGGLTVVDPSKIGISPSKSDVGGSTVNDLTKIGISPLNWSLVVGSGSTVVDSNKIGFSPYIFSFVVGSGLTDGC